MPKSETSTTDDDDDNKQSNKNRTKIKQKSETRTPDDDEDDTKNQQNHNKTPTKKPRLGRLTTKKTTKIDNKAFEILEGSFSAVSTPIFATKYSLELRISLESYSRDLLASVLIENE